MVDLIINVTGIEATSEMIKESLEAAVVQGTMDILDAVEQEQILSYTANSNPEQPAGTLYKRTFRLQRSSKKRMVSASFPNIIGRWISDARTASYTRYVIGRRNQQAPIHRDRWKSLEQVEAAITEKGPQIMEKRTNEIQIS